MIDIELYLLTLLNKQLFLSSNPGKTWDPVQIFIWTFLWKYIL